jgi:phytol kinase
MFFAKASAVLLFLTLILILSYVFGKRYHLHLEVQRKQLHMALGFAALSFPLVFDTTLEIAILLSAAFIVQLSLRYVLPLRRTLGESIFGVKRSWLGGGLFLVSIFALFVYAKDNYTLYAGPLLLLTFADALAAIVGTKYGRKYYALFGGNKSIEGAMAFCVTAFFAIFLLLIFMTGHSVLMIMFISGGVAIFCTAAELFAGKALDNLTVPFAAFCLLQHLL